VPLDVCAGRIEHSDITLVVFDDYEAVLPGVRRRDEVGVGAADQSRLQAGIEHADRVLTRSDKASTVGSVLQGGVRLSAIAKNFQLAPSIGVSQHDESAFG
jgi:hypothetical protein